MRGEDLNYDNDGDDHGDGDDGDEGGGEEEYGGEEKTSLILLGRHKIQPICSPEYINH